MFCRVGMWSSCSLAPMPFLCAALSMAPSSRILRLPHSLSNKSAVFVGMDSQQDGEGEKPGASSFCPEGKVVGYPPCYDFLSPCRIFWNQNNSLSLNSSCIESLDDLDFTTVASVIVESINEFDRLKELVKRYAI